MIRILKTLALAMPLLMAGLCAASAATLLPNGEQTFTDGNGVPLAGGRVYFFTPNTSTAKTTWQDSGQTKLNANPVVLDSAGRAIIYGTGTYRQVVKDSIGNTVWDQLTSDGSATNANWAGVSAGTANAQTVASTSFSQSDGQTIFFRAGFTNTGAVTLNANGIGAVPVLQDTLRGPVGLLGGEVTAGNVYQVIYDAFLGAYHLGAHPSTSPFITIASAATTDIGSLATPNVIVSGNAAITSFGSSASINNGVYLVKFTGNATLTYNATSMILPSAVNMTTAVGEVVTAIYLGSGNWQIQPSAPTGKVEFYNLAACPVGYVAANGAGGTVDARGVALRGLDNGRGLDPSRSLASYQADQLQTITGTVSSYATNSSTGNVATTSSGATAPIFGFTSLPVTFGGATFGAETRMKNLALLACQKS